MPPSYDQKSFARTVWTNRLVPVASGQGLPDVVTFHTDATLYLGSLEAQHSVTHATNGSRRMFVYLTEGELAVDGGRLYTKDQGRIDTEAPLTLTAHQDTRFVLIDVPRAGAGGTSRQPCDCAKSAAEVEHAGTLQRWGHAAQRWLFRCASEALA